MNTTILAGQEEYLGGDIGRILEHHIKLLMQHLLALQHSEYDIFETLSEERRGRILLLTSVLCCEIESLYHQISENPPLKMSSESDDDLTDNSIIFNKSPNRRLS